MTPKSFFCILLRVIGIFLVLKILMLLPQQVFTVPFYLISIENSGGNEIFIGILITILYLLVLYLVTYYCILYPTKIIEKIRLAKDFEEEKFDINISHTTILRIAVIVIGGIVLKDAIPYFIENLVLLWQYKVVTWQTFPQLSYLVFSIISLIIGYLLIANSKAIVDFFEKRSKKETEKEE
jgi:hypothetical protein